MPELDIMAFKSLQTVNASSSVEKEKWRIQRNFCSTTIIKHFTATISGCKMLNNGRRTKIQSSAESWERDLSEYEFNYAINIICVDPTSLTRMMSIWCRFDASSFLALMSKFVSMNLLLVFSFLHKNLCSSLLFRLW